MDYVPTMLVGTFKSAIALLVPEMPISMDAFYMGKLMVDEATMNAYGIKDGAKILMCAVKKPQGSEDAELHTVPVPGEDQYVLVTRQQPDAVHEKPTARHSNSTFNPFVEFPSWSSRRQDSSNIFNRFYGLSSSEEASRRRRYALLSPQEINAPTMRKVEDEEEEGGRDVEEEGGLDAIMSDLYS